MNTTHCTHHLPFGVSQGLAFGVIMLGSVMLANISGAGLRLLPTAVIPGSVLGYVDALLWLVEIGLFWFLAFGASKGSHAMAGVGVALGLICHGLYAMIGLALPHHAGGPLLRSVLHLWGIGVGAASLQFSFRLLLEFHFNRKKLLASHTKKTAVPTTPSFAFRAKQPTVTEPAAPIRRQEPVAAVKTFGPPEGFSVTQPASGVKGTVSVPREVILKSIPDVDEYLVEPRTRIQLAWIIPQLHRPTMWLTWEQLFAEPLPDIPAPLQVKLRDHWVRLPARYVVMQIPEEYFEHTPKLRRWALLKPVPEEEPFVLHCEKVG